MRKTLVLLLLLAPAACGGRTIGEWPTAASGAGGLGSSITSGGAAPFMSGGGGGVAPGGQSSTGGAPSASGGVPAGGLGGSVAVSGGRASGGSASGGTPVAGSGGSEPCFEATQSTQGLCIHVRLCSAAQYETLCLMDTPTSAVCFCYVDGMVQSASSFLRATEDTLCDPAVAAACP